MAFLCALLLFGCTGKGRQPAEVGADIDAADSTVLAEEEEVAGEPDNDEERLIAEEPMPLAADEFFDDFIFNFSANRRLQVERISFPLPVHEADRVDSIMKRQWQVDHFFMRQDFYTLIFNSAEQLEQVKEMAIDSAILEKIYLDKSSVKQYVFTRLGGRWMMTQIHNQPMEENHNASFLEFYRKFAADTLFQRNSLAEQIDFVGPDPDDDFAQMEGVITPDFWDAFAPELPTGMIYNIVYGAPQTETDTKVFVVRGIANGLELELTFRRQAGQWRLTKLTT